MKHCLFLKNNFFPCFRFGGSTQGREYSRFHLSRFSAQTQSHLQWMLSYITGIVPTREKLKTRRLTLIGVLSWLAGGESFKQQAGSAKMRASTYCSCWNIASDDTTQTTHAWQTVSLLWCSHAVWFLPSKMYPERQKSTVVVDWETGDIYGPCEQKERERCTVLYSLQYRQELPSPLKAGC
jgi:hypothetical protein